MRKNIKSVKCQGLAAKNDPTCIHADHLDNPQDVCKNHKGQVTKSEDQKKKEEAAKDKLVKDKLK